MSDTMTTLAEIVELHRWPTADEIADPICAALRRLNDLCGVADDIGRHLEAGHHDPDSIAIARRYANLIGEIARRCRAVADNVTVHHVGSAGLAMDSVIRMIANDQAVVSELHHLEHPTQ